MEIQLLSRRAVRKYAELDFALDAVCQALDEVRSLVDRQASDFHSYAVPDRETLTAALGRAASSVGSLRRSAKEGEGELLARDWR